MNLQLHSNGKFLYQKELEKKFKNKAKTIENSSLLEKLKYRFFQEIKKSEYFNF